MPNSTGYLQNKSPLSGKMILTLPRIQPGIHSPTGAQVALGIVSARTLFFVQKAESGFQPRFRPVVFRPCASAIFIDSIFRAHSGIRPVVIYMTEWSGHNVSENCPIIPWPPEQNAKGGGSVQPKKLWKLRGMGARIRTVPDLIPRHSFCVTQRAAWKTGGKPPLKVRAKRRSLGKVH